MNVIAIDIGGTSIVGGLINKDGKINYRVNINTEAEAGGTTVIHNVMSVIKQLIDYAQKNDIYYKTIGVSTAGQVDPHKGVIKYATDIFSDWQGRSIKSEIENEFGIKTFIENDAHAAGWGEKYFGKAKNVNDFFILTLGTGVGGSIFTKGKLLSGNNNLAGLLGHICLNPEGFKCSCGATGCLETYASAKGIAKLVGIVSRNKQNTYLVDIIEDIPESDISKIIFKKAVEGDEIALEVVNIVTKYLGSAIGSIVNMLNPEMGILAGGISNAGDILLNNAIKYAKMHSTPVAFEKFDLVLSKFLGYTGLLGAAAVAYSQGIPRI